MEQERQLVLFLVFEHVDQDLASYLANCPSPGLGPDKIKVKLEKSLFINNNFIELNFSGSYVPNTKWS